MGNVIQAGNGQNPARQAALNGGLADHVAALTINKVCGSGLKAVMLAAQGIATGDIEIAVAGGMESMSNAPYLLPRVREGLRMGNGELIDSLVHDGLWCSFEQCHMGMSGEVVAEKYGVGRSEQDEYAAASHRKAAEATRAGVVRRRDPADHHPAEEGRGRRRRSRRTHPRGHDGRGARRAEARVQERRDGHGWKRAGGQRRGRRAGGDVRGQSARAWPCTARAHRRAGDERPRAEDGDDDAGRGRQTGRREDRLEPGRRRSLRDQRSLLGAGRRRHARAGHRPGARQRSRRRGGARPSDRRQRRTCPDDADSCDAPAPARAAGLRRCASAAATAWRSRWKSNRGRGSRIRGPADQADLRTSGL